MKNKTAYRFADIPEMGRYWFSRETVDENLGKVRKINISVEGRENGAWGIKIEEVFSGQIWQLCEAKVGDEERQVFERAVNKKGILKNDLIPLSHVPGWLIEELKLVVKEIKLRNIDEEARKYLSHLKNFIVKEKLQTREKLTAKIEETKIGGLYKINAETKGDSRGSFREVVRFPEIELLTGYDFLGKQVNHSYSIYGTLRGLHVEPWAKLVTVISGLVVCKLLDCRPKSKTFGQVETIYLGFGKTPDGQEIKGGAMFVGAGIANSFMVLSDKVDYSYVVDDLWTPGTSTYCVNPMDPKLGIDWTSYVPEEKIIRSERDIKAPSFEEFSQKIKNL